MLIPKLAITKQERTERESRPERGRRETGAAASNMTELLISGHGYLSRGRLF